MGVLGPSLLIESYKEILMNCNLLIMKADRQTDKFNAKFSAIRYILLNIYTTWARESI